MTLHCVYYCYDAKGDILYIGCTKKMLQRLSWHRSSSAWVQDLYKIKLRWFPSFCEARHFEGNAISRNRPEYNRLEAAYRNGNMVWVKPKREMPTLTDDCLKRYKSIRVSLKRRIAARVEKQESAT